MAVVRAYELAERCNVSVCALWEEMKVHEGRHGFTLPKAAPRFHVFRMGVPEGTSLYGMGITHVELDVSPYLEGNRVRDGGVGAGASPQHVAVRLVDVEGRVTHRHRCPTSLVFASPQAVLVGLETLRDWL